MFTLMILNDENDIALPGVDTRPPRDDFVAGENLRGGFQEREE